MFSALIGLVVFATSFSNQNDLVKSLIGSGRDIFSPSGNEAGTNPYAPNTSTQFELILSADSDAIDRHGRFQGAFLDEIFQYVEVGGSSSLRLNSGTPKFSDELRDLLVLSYYEGEQVNQDIKKYEDCDEPLEEEDCEKKLENLYPIRDDFIARGLGRGSLDESRDLIFGAGTTPGQVCAFARGLEDGFVEDVPGFCCLDAPYEAYPDWGEQVRRLSSSV